MRILKIIALLTYAIFAMAILGCVGVESDADSAFSKSSHADSTLKPHYKETLLDYKLDKDTMKRYKHIIELLEQTLKSDKYDESLGELLLQEIEKKNIWAYDILKELSKKGYITDTQKHLALESSIKACKDFPLFCIANYHDSKEAIKEIAYKRDSLNSQIIKVSLVDMQNPSIKLEDKLNGFKSLLSLLQEKCISGDDNACMLYIDAGFMATWYCATCDERNKQADEVFKLITQFANYRVVTETVCKKYLIRSCWDKDIASNEDYIKNVKEIVLPKLDRMCKEGYPNACLSQYLPLALYEDNADLKNVVNRGCEAGSMELCHVKYFEMWRYKR